MTKIEWTDALRIRFWSKVRQPSAFGCWEWTGAKNAPGYGRIRIEGRSRYAHRVMFELSRGRTPRGVIMHTCDNPACVQPDHLRDATQRENVRDCHAKGRNRTPRGAGNGRSRLTAGAVRSIRAELRAGASLRAIASQYGVGHTTIANIKSGATWSHV